MYKIADRLERRVVAYLFATRFDNYSIAEFA
jgi:hypothetical protein